VDPTPIAIENFFLLHVFRNSLIGAKAFPLPMLVFIFVESSIMLSV
jgi:hypothetical protein